MSLINRKRKPVWILSAFMLSTCLTSITPLAAQAQASVDQAKTPSDIVRDAKSDIVNSAKKSASETTKAVANSAQNVVENTTSNVSNLVTSTAENTSQEINNKTNQFFNSAFGISEK